MSTTTDDVEMTSSLQSKSNHNIDDNGYDESESLLLDDKSVGASVSEIHNIKTSDYSAYNVKRIVTILMISIVLLIIPLTRRFQNKMIIPTTTIDNNITKEMQISNYINGNALLLSVHITHHAGTSICKVMKKLGPVPSFACMVNKNDDNPWSSNNTLTKDEKKSWTHNNTANYTQSFHSQFHFMSQEYKDRGKGLQDTFWEYENLTSFIVLRDPLERFLAGGKCGPFHVGKAKALGGIDPGNDTLGYWWDYANSNCADNFALRILTDEECVINGAETNETCVDSAKALLKRFTFILDQACLNESMIAMGKVLNLNITEKDFEDKHFHHVHVASVRERLNNDTLYEYLQQRFRRDIELYEWSKNQSIIQCNSR